MRFLPCLMIGGAVALAVTAEGCTDRACLEWQMAAQGPCPDKQHAREFFGECSDVERVDSEPTYLADEGGLCCYDVTHVPLGNGIPCRSSTTTRTRTHTSPSSGGGSETTTTTTPTTTTTETTSGGGSSGSCETCNEVLASGNDGSVCGDQSTSALTALVSCGCSAPCAGSCHDFCAVGAAPDSACSTCLGASCASELSTCEAH